MVRLRDNATGVVVTVSEDVAERLGGHYTPVVEKSKAQPKSRAKRDSAKEDKKE